MQTKTECTTTVRRRALLPGGQILAGVLAGLLAFAAFAATDPDAVSIMKKKAADDHGKAPAIVAVDESGAPVGGASAGTVQAPKAAPINTAAKPTTLAGTGSAPAVTPQAAPGNDDCTGAIAIPDGPFPIVSAISDLTEATPLGADEGLLSCAATDATVWYSFTPSATAFYIISTCQGNGATGSNVYDTVLGVFTSTGGVCPENTEAACNDSAGGCSTAGGGAPYWDQSILGLVLNAGETYFIVAGHWATDVGGIAPGFNQVAVQIDKSPAPANDTCASPGVLQLNRAVRGTTAAAQNDYQSPANAACYSGIGQTPSAGPGRDVVYSFTAPAAGSYNFKWVQDAPAPALRGQNPVLYASSSCGPAGEVTCLKGANRETPASGLNKAEEIDCLPLAAGQTIYVYFDDHAAGNGGGEFDLEVTNCAPESEPNDDIASANAYGACFTQGSASPAGDVDFFSLGTPPAGSRVFAAIDGAQTNNSDWEMRITNSTDTLQYDNNDGTSITGSNAPVIAGAPTDGSETFVRLSKVGAVTLAEPYHLYARVETGPVQVETEPNNIGPGNVTRIVFNEPITGGGWIRGSASAATDSECVHFIAYEGDDIAMFAGANPDRVPGGIVDMWPTLYDMAPSGYNLFTFGGQVARNLLGASPGTLTGVTPSITSEFHAHRARYTGLHAICYYPIQASGGFPLPWQASISLNCGPIPHPATLNADVSVTKTGPASPVPTSSITSYTVEITNNGTDVAQNIHWTDTLPPELTLLDLVVNDGFGGENTECLSFGPIDCNHGSIAPGETITVTMTVLVAGCIGDVEISNTVTIAGTESTDPDPSNNSSTWVFTTSDSGSCTDFDECTVGDTCDAGVCVSTGPLDCDDQSLCTDDFCDSGLGCIHDPTPGQQCNDGLDCTADLCDPAFGLEENGHCYFPPAPVGTSCNDFFNCTNPDACDAEGNCVGAPVSCDDGVPCTADSCDEGTGGCVNTQVPAGTACEDANACVTGDTCDADGVCQSGGGTLDCDDGNPCTDDSCDPDSGCVYTNNSNACDDGDACTQSDSCSAGVCVGSNPVVCTASDQCHDTGVCDPGTGICSDPVKPDGSACDDGDDCTTDDQCTAGVCFGPTPSLGEPNPRTNGYYKRLCRGPHSGDELTAADAQCVATTASATFGWVQSVADICSVIEPAQPNNDMCQQSEDDLMVLALNLCNARVCPNQGIDSQCGSNASVSQSLAEMDAIFSDPGRDFDTCQLGKCLGEEINTGRAIDVNSLVLSVSANGTVLTWQPAYQDNSQNVLHYNVWRREVGNGAFAKIATVNELTFTDPTVGSFEYEVTAKH